ncbi:hypothetical protein Y023_5309 [Burkholderia pseudomallei A79D]|nr:hypothetical protein Y023_5309 [Burkholderia pseudomallei A79D]
MGTRRQTAARMTGVRYARLRQTSGARINRDTHAQPRHFEHASIPSRVPSLLPVRTSAHAAPARPFDAPRAARYAPARKARSARAGVGARRASLDTANRKRRTS